MKPYQLLYINDVKLLNIDSFFGDVISDDYYDYYCISMGYRHPYNDHMIILVYFR